MLLLYLTLITEGAISVFLLRKRYFLSTLCTAMVSAVLLRFAFNLFVAESIALTLIVEIIVIVICLSNWKYRHPRYILTLPFLTMCIAIMICIYLTLAAFLYFFYNRTGNGFNWVIGLFESFHFAINMMIKGGLDKDYNSLAYVILNSMSNYKTPIPYWATALIISIAPISALGWLVSLFETSVFQHIKLVFLRNSNKQMYVFADTSERSIILAKAIAENIGKKKARYCFCRCGKHMNNVQPEMLSEIASINGIMLTKSEIDYEFIPQKTEYYYCLNNHYSLNKSIRNLDEQEWNKSVDDKRIAYLITDDILENPMTIINEGNNLELVNYSVWETLLEFIVASMVNNEIKTVFVAGKGRILSILVKRWSRIINKVVINQKKKSINEIIVFPESEEEYVDLLTDNSSEKQLIIKNPQEYVSSMIEKEISSYLQTYKTESKRGVVLISDDSLINIMMKRRLADIAKSYIQEEQLTIYTYCNDSILKNNEKDRDKKGIEYYGEDEDVIPKIAIRILRH